MTIKKQKEYQVINGEPHLGKQIETTCHANRDEIIEAITWAILEGMVLNVDDDFYLKLENNAIGVPVKDYVSKIDLQYTFDVIDRELLDDDYGSGKDMDLVYDLIDDAVAKDAFYEIDIIEMKG